jgi:hypothetical protein
MFLVRHLARRKVFRDGVLSTQANYTLSVLFSLLSLFRKNRSRLMRKPCCLCVYVSPNRLLNGWPNLYETWYVYHGTWAHINAYLTNPSRQSVCLYVYFPVLWIHNASVNTFPRQWRNVGGVVFYAVRVVSKKSCPLVHPGTSVIIVKLVSRPIV